MFIDAGRPFWLNGGMKLTISLLLLIGISGQAAYAQTLDEDVKAMRAEIQRLREEVAELRQELHGTTATTQQDTSELSPMEAVPLIQAQVRELAQSKVETNSKFPMKVFGTIFSNTVWNSGEANWLDIPNLVEAIPPGRPTGSFTSTLRQTRVGAMLDGPFIGSMKASAFLAMDFYGGIPNFATGPVMGLPRLVYAYGRLDGKRTAFEVGQDYMIVAPRNPTSLSNEAFPMLYRAGNLYLRVPQVRAEEVLAAGGFGEIRATGGIVAPIAGDNTNSQYDFDPPTLAGERSRMPGFQGRLSWRAAPAGPYEKPKWEFGGSGHYSRDRYLNGSLISNIPSWVGAFDFDLTVGRFGTGGEYFYGRNIAQFGGSVGQIARSRGGFVEGRFAASRQLSFNGGYGSDRLFNLSHFPVPLSSNSGAFGNWIYQFTPEFAASMEYQWLGTRPLLTSTRQNRHVGLTFAYSF